MKLLFSILLLSAITCHGQLTTTTHTPSWNSTFPVGIKTDTIDWEKPILTLSAYGTLTAEDTSYKGNNNYANNKCDYIFTRVDQEIQYWHKEHNKAWQRYSHSNNIATLLDEYLVSLKQIEYWSGVKAGIQAALYTACDGYNFQYELKTKPNKKQE
jgi:hypothetical protein